MGGMSIYQKKSHVKINGGGGGRECVLTGNSASHAVTSQNALFYRAGNE